MMGLGSLSNLTSTTSDSMVSVVVPVYNAEKWLSDCLSSIQGQTLQNIEIIMVDDGSTDRSGAILDAMALEDDRVRIIHTSNQGVSCARNTGVNHATGKYIAFVDSDDLSLSTYLETLLLNLQEYNADLSVCDIFDGVDEGSPARGATAGLFQLDPDGAERFFELNRLFLLYGPYCKMYRKELIDQYRIRFDPSCSYGEDLLFNFEYLEHVENIVVSDQALYRYRCSDEEGRLSTKYYPHKFEIDMHQLAVIYDCFEKRGVWSEKAKNWWWTRYFWILHDCLFLINHPEARLSVFWKYKRVKAILSHPQLTQALKKADTSKCSSFILYLIRIRSALGFVAVNTLINVKNKALK